jgi:hypothetical protein
MKKRVISGTGGIEDDIELGEEYSFKHLEDEGDKCKSPY